MTAALTDAVIGNRTAVVTAIIVKIIVLHVHFGSNISNNNSSSGAAAAPVVVARAAVVVVAE